MCYSSDDIYLYFGCHLIYEINTLLYTDIHQAVHFTLQVVCHMAGIYSWLAVQLVPDLNYLIKFRSASPRGYLYYFTYLATFAESVSQFTIRLLQMTPIFLTDPFSKMLSRCQYIGPLRTTLDHHAVCFPSALKLNFSFPLLFCFVFVNSFSFL